MSNFHFVDENHSRDILHILNVSRATGALCDVCLRVRTENGSNRDFPAHSLILGAASPYFKNLFQNGVEEGAIIVEELTDADILREILDFIYNGSVLFRPANIFELFDASVLFKLDSLTKACLDYMQKLLNKENVLKILYIAGKHDASGVLRKARVLFARNFTELSKSNAFLDVGAKELKRVLAEDCLIVENEMEVYVAVKNWIEHDISSRLKYVALLLSNVRFRFLTHKFLTTAHAHDPIMMTSPLAQDFANEALAFEELSVEDREKVHTARVKPRWCTQALKVISLIGGISTDQPTFSTGHWVFHPASNQWYTAGPLLSPRCHFGVLERDESLYVFGGCASDNNEKMLRTVEVYNPKVNQWKTVATKMKEERCRFDVVEVGDDIYLVGGFCSDPHQNSLEIYLPTANNGNVKPKYASTLLAPPLRPRYDHCTAVLDGKIYFIGGCTRGHVVLKDVECYDPELNTWTDVSQLLAPRSGACAVVVESCIVVIGGSNKRSPLKSCEIYDVTKQQWAYFPPLNERRDRCSAAVFQGNIYVFGGSYGQIIQDSVECYSPLTNEWKVVSHLPSSKYGFKCLTTVVNRDLVEEIGFDQV